MLLFLEAKPCGKKNGCDVYCDENGNERFSVEDEGEDSIVRDELTKTTIYTCRKNNSKKCLIYDPFKTGNYIFEYVCNDKSVIILKNKKTIECDYYDGYSFYRSENIIFLTNSKKHTSCVIKLNEDFDDIEYQRNLGYYIKESVLDFFVYNHIIARNSDGKYGMVAIEKLSGKDSVVLSFEYNKIKKADLDYYIVEKKWKIWSI